MRYFSLFLMACVLVFAGCKSSEQTTKSESKKETKKESKKELAKQELEKEKQEKERLEQERIAKEREEKKAKEDLEKQKIESEKQKNELKKVQDNLKRMGLAAFRVDVTRENNQFKYADGRTVIITGSPKDQTVISALNDLLNKAKDDERKKLNSEPACSGGYETCQEGWLYIYYMVRSSDGSCGGEWFKTGQECK